MNIRRRRVGPENTEDKFIEKFRAVLNDNNSLSIFNKKKRSICIVRRDLAKSYEITVEASEAPLLNKMLSEQEPYESSMADVKILEEEVFPINEAFQKVFGMDKEFKLNAIKLAIGGNYNDYVTIEQNDLVRFDVKPTLTGLNRFITENKESILGFLDCEYISEEGNVIYLNCSKKNVSDKIFSIKLLILASMQQRGFFLQQEHKYYGLQLYVVIESRKANDPKLLEFLKELDIDWELIYFRRKLAIHDWIEIECEKDSENLKGFLRAKYETLNYFDVNNIIRLIVKNQLPFKVAYKMASLLFEMKNERASRLHDPNFQENNYKEDQNQQDEYSITLKKAEIAAAAKIACAYLGIHQEINFDRDISVSEILKYQEELTNM
ncbi:MAG: hypothetical protein KGD58_03690 [Candidatus Lokiarchaeota archaeon]|nr:hypothetical protein [Candidatus Lokiarchaeota archaeon]